MVIFRTSDVGSLRATKLQILIIEVIKSLKTQQFYVLLTIKSNLSTKTACFGLAPSSDQTQEQYTKIVKDKIN
jgi:hypothetical protein